MQNPTPTSTPDNPPRVESIEHALDALVSAAPKRGEKIHSFVRRCVSVVVGQAQRDHLFDAVMSGLNELGLRAVDPATQVRAAFQAIDEASAAPVAA